MDRNGIGRTCRRAMVVAGLLLAGAAGAGTTGKIAGRVVDAKGQPLVAVNVAVPGARTGALTDADGRYVIVNVPAGTYEVRVSLLGYRALLVQDVVVSADHTTAVDAKLEEAAVEMAEVVVTAQRPVVDVHSTSTIATVTRKEIASLPVQELQDVVNLQAGVVDGHFRGGRIGEVQFQVDGVTVNNPYDNKSTLRLDRSLLEEVQVISGTFDAEYGQAMSGVVNAVLRRGSDQFRWDAEALVGGFAFKGGERRRTESHFDPAGQQNYQASLSGPLHPLPKTFFLVNARHSSFDDYLQAERRFTPITPNVPDSLGISPPVYKVLHPDGDGGTEPLGTATEWSGLMKLTNRSISNLELSYQAVLNQLERRETDWLYRLTPDALSHKQTLSVSHGVDAVYTFSKSTFTLLSLRQNYFDYHDWVYEDVYDSRYDAAGPPVGFPDYEYNAAVEGVQPNRFEQRTNAIIAKGTLTSQRSTRQQFKLGGEMQWPNITFGVPGHLVFGSVAGQETLLRVIDDPPLYPAVQDYHPRIVAAFVHSESEWSDVILRAGLRFDYFNPMAGLPSDLSNPANSIAGAPPSTFDPASRKYSLSPRIGLSYPVTRDAALFFAYGHFVQLPELGLIYTNADYGALRQLQASSTEYEIFGNPDIKPERSVHYQFGYRQAFTEWLGVEANMFYKDIRDLLGVEFITTYNDAEYARWTNVDFGRVIGFTVVVDQRQRGLFSSTLDYTWQSAQGNSSDPRETATRASAGEDPRPRVIPFNWDQRHTLNATFTVSRPADFNATAVVRVASGQPYTPQIETGFLTGFQVNSGRKPTGMVVDVRAEKTLRLGVGATLFGRVFNLFDTRFFNGSVYGTTGSPYYSRFPETDRIALADPTRLYKPRRIEVGVTLGGGGK